MGARRPRRGPCRGLAGRGERAPQAVQALALDVRAVRREREPQRRGGPAPRRTASRDEGDLARRARARSSASASQPSGSRTQTNMPPSGRVAGASRRGSVAGERRRRSASRRGAVGGAQPGDVGVEVDGAEPVRGGGLVDGRVCRSAACLATTSARRSAAGARSQPMRRPGASDLGERRERDRRGPRRRAAAPAAERLAAVAQLAVGVVLDEPQAEALGGRGQRGAALERQRAAGRVVERRDRVEQLGRRSRRPRGDRVGVQAVVVARRRARRARPPAAKHCSAAR